MDLKGGMAYTGECPMKAHGTSLGEKPVDMDTMFKGAGLNWKVRKSPILLDNGNAAASSIAGYRAIVRDDTGDVLSIVKPGYEIVQNESAMRLLDDIVGSGAACYRAAGELRGGRTVWAMLHVGHADIRRLDGREDPLDDFLLLATSHDRTMGVRVGFTRSRLWCLNQLGAAFEHALNGVVLRHTSNIEDRVHQARDTLGIARTYFDESTRSLQKFADTPMRVSEFKSFAEQLMLDTEIAIEDAKQTLGDRARKNLDQNVDTLANLFTGGVGNTGESRYDALNAVTEYVDHVRAAGRRAGDQVRADLARLDSAWFGKGATLKQRAVRLLQR